MALPKHAAMWAIGAVGVAIGGLYLYRHAGDTDSGDSSADSSGGSMYPLFQTAAVPQYAGGGASGASTATAGNTTGTGSSASGIDAGTLSDLISGAGKTQADQANTGLAAQLFSQFGKQQSGATAYSGDFSSVAGVTHFNFTSAGSTPTADTGAFQSAIDLLKSGFTSLSQRADNQDAWNLGVANNLTAQTEINKGVQSSLGDLSTGAYNQNVAIGALWNQDTLRATQIGNLSGQVGGVAHSSAAALSEINQIAGSLWSKAGVPTQWAAESKAAGNAA